MDGAAQLEIAETHEMLAVPADIACGIVIIRIGRNLVRDFAR